MRLTDFFEQFSIENRETLRHTTRAIHYRQAVRAYVEYFGEAVDVDHITAESLEQFRNWWLKQPSNQLGKTRTGLS